MSSNEAEAGLRRRLHRYLNAVEPLAIPSVIGICITGSLATPYADEHSDIDLTVVIEDDGVEPDPERFSNKLIPLKATVQRRVPLEKYSFDWRDGHIDIDVVGVSELRAEGKTLQTRWEYDNAEILVDSEHQLSSCLAEEIPLSDEEQHTLVQEYADEFLFIAQWDTHKACLRESYRTAHRAATCAADDALALLFLQDGQFVPREKWIVDALGSVQLVDEELVNLTWEASRIIACDPHDVHRRVQALHSIWERLQPTLEQRGFFDEDAFTWEAPPREICMLNSTTSNESS